MDPNPPSVSVIIPAFNAEATIADCLESVLKQDYPRDRMDVLVVDNGSEDHTADLAARYPVIVLHEKQVRSSYAARNRGILHAKGEILAFTDTDCIASPDWLRNLVADCPDERYGCFAGRIESFPPATLAERFAQRDEENHNQERSILLGYLPSANTANAAYRREVFDRIGLFNHKLRSGGDAEFGWRMSLKTGYKIRYQPRAVIFHRHRSSLGALFRQHRRYGEGITELQKMYPGSCVSMTWFAQDIFRFTFQGLRRLPKNLLALLRGKGSAIDVWYSFIKAYCRIGLTYGRLLGYGKTPGGDISPLLIFRFVAIKTLDRLKKFPRA